MNKTPFLLIVLISLLTLLTGCDRPRKNATPQSGQRSAAQDSSIPIDAKLADADLIAPEIESIPVSQQEAKEEAQTLDQEEKPEKLLTAEDVQNQTRQAIETAQQFAIQREKELHLTIDQQYNAFLSELDQLKNKATAMRSEAKTKVTEELQKVGNDMSETAAKLQTIENSSSETLAKLSQELESMLEKMKMEGAPGPTE